MKTIAIVKYAFTLIGIGMLVGAGFLYQHTTAFIAEAITAQGVVIDLARSRSSDSTTYAPVVRFTDRQGRKIEFTSSTSSNPPSYSRGERVQVLYLPEEPEQAKIDGFFSLWGAALIVGGLGGIFFLVGGGMLLFGMLGRREDAYLMQQGMPIETEFQSVQLNTAYSVNGRHPFRVLSQWQNPSTMEIHVFESDNLWFDPSDYIGERKIRVFIERNNPKRYHVDLSFLPELAK